MLTRRQSLLGAAQGLAAFGLAPDFPFSRCSGGSGAALTLDGNNNPTFYFYDEDGRQIGTLDSFGKTTSTRSVAETAP